MILVLDNYDSFTYNLVQLLGQLEAGEIQVRRNDELSLQEVRALGADRIVVSPGPGRPEGAGVSIGLFGETVPVLGVCLGHQALGVAYGAEVVQAERRLHGKVSKIYHDQSQLFQGISNPFQATRYHSLIVREDSLPSDLVVTAWTSDGEIMGLQHRERPHFGVQFHPESILTPEGSRLLRNFLDVRA
ncbi:MAG: aminodeoxychorismate/anthranilate synthase component II [Candidatus Eremiobacteraeota bacterium]|nr:aminodeoxychorismate/anthranilate synthase component II [Candidatus Eremiobacteraeota bacterium]